MKGLGKQHEQRYGLEKWLVNNKKKRSGNSRRLQNLDFEVP